MKPALAPALPVDAGPIRQSRQGLLVILWGALLVLYVVHTFVFKVKSMPLEWLWWTVLLLPLAPWWMNRRSIRALSVPTAQCAPFHRHEPGEMAVTLRNASPALVADITLECPKLKEGVEGELEGRGSETFMVGLKDVPRGIHPLPPLKLTSRFPFGLFVSDRVWKPQGECVVYPALEPNAPAWPSTAHARFRRSRAGEEIVAFRDYVVGDAISTIDWKITARHGDLVVREFEEPVFEALMFAFEDVSFLGLEAALERLAAWVVRASRQGLTYGLRLEGLTIEPGTGPAHTTRCLRALASFQQEAFP